MKPRRRAARAAVAREFPGEIAGASLKRARGADGVGRGGDSPAKSPGPH